MPDDFPGFGKRREGHLVNYLVDASALRGVLYCRGYISRGLPNGFKTRIQIGFTIQRHVGGIEGFYPRQFLQREDWRCGDVR
ncbi:hypothetical protein D3C77_537220 [compost metagenome]